MASSDAVRLAIRILVGVVATVVLLVVALRIPGPVSTGALPSSLAREARSAALYDGPCRTRVEDRWTCSVADGSGSGGAEYAVRRDGWSCWQARRISADGFEDTMPARLRGCVRWLRD